jgi:hypothetical protein
VGAVFRAVLRPKILREGEDYLSNHQLCKKNLQCGIISILMMMIIIIIIIIIMIM